VDSAVKFARRQNEVTFPCVTWTPRDRHLKTRAYHREFAVCLARHPWWPAAARRSWQPDCREMAAQILV